MKQIEQNILKAIPLLKRYEALICKWQKAVNLVSSKSLNELWERHILDSAQLYAYLPKEAQVLVDMGSGAGFPGLVLAVLNHIYHGGLTSIYLVESDSKKCIFLREAARELGVSVHVLNKRIEEITDIKADVITSRALARVDKLLAYGMRFLKKNTVFLLLKGEGAPQELIENKVPCYVEMFSSQTEKQGCILRITEVENND